ncbi:hypothetical protein HAT2_00188 [Candidatus Similichlamydia laticola]|uniref:Uncharacterized protein n=1 Tax=Candidatus Similichlamydia laticola TaxID=2170265 RepID=A0A369KDZ9_9BACT|nr:hypothetical protein HAT2_00188 [Candidatus Similichlamydia laticola]
MFFRKKKGVLPCQVRLHLNSLQIKAFLLCFFLPSFTLQGVG